MLLHALIPISIALFPIPSDSPPPLPTAAQLATLRTREDVIGVARLEDGSSAPAAIVLPVLQNRRQTLAYMLANYPKGNTKAKSGGIAWVRVGRDGLVYDARIVQSSGNKNLDSLAIKAFNVATFTPAMVGSDSVGLWLPFPAYVPTREELDLALAAADAPNDHRSRPMNLPFTEPPELLNRSRVEAAVVRYIYSVDRGIREANERMARVQNIGGNVLMWIYVDAEGNVANAIIKKSSGINDLDNAALQIANVMRFAPAKNNGVETDAWIEAPIAFKKQ